jgi:hypothetical protein
LFCFFFAGATGQLCSGRKPRLSPASSKELMGWLAESAAGDFQPN